MENMVKKDNADIVILDEGNLDDVNGGWIIIPDIFCGGCNFGKCGNCGKVSNPGDVINPSPF